MTEEEATRTLCHKTLEAYWTGTERKTIGSRCIGSECQAWRFSGLADEDVGTKPAPRPNVRPLNVPGHEWRPQDRENSLVSTWALFPKLGYCGLVGEPK